ncbi:hypothetical protein GF386_02030 [Candidatus Pacearchaeota archaeon]|nr:hypothetical protein [Candidatus Pacearchaeota archaeon]MBD3282952.1 hypothetical protein [Candidatus Pacearchaeota archaeon]
MSIKIFSGREETSESVIRKARIELLRLYEGIEFYLHIPGNPESIVIFDEFFCIVYYNIYSKAG